MERTNEVVKAVIGLTAAPGAVAMSFDERIMLVLRLLGVAFGCAVSLAMFWSILSSRADKRAEAAIRMAREREELSVQRVAYQREVARLCHYCQQGQKPPQCPLPPGQCPLKRAPKAPAI